MNKPVLMKNPSSVANGWNGACADWEAYHKELLAPLKEVWEKYGYFLDDKYTCAHEATIELLKAIKPIAEVQKWK